MKYQKLMIKSIWAGLIILGGLVTSCVTDKPTDEPSVQATFTPTNKPSVTLPSNQSPSSTPKPSATLTPNPSPTATLTPTPLDPRANLEPGLYIVYWSQKTLYLHSTVVF